MSIEEKVQKWNELYEAIPMREVKDMGEKEYEGFVMDCLFEIVDTLQEALDVLTHNDNKGGWMLGDVAGKLKEMIKEEA